MKKDIVNKKKLVLSIAVCALFVTVAFSGVVAKDVKDKPDLDWDYWSNEPHMFSNVTGNVGIGTTDPTGKLEVVGDIVVSGLVDGIDIDVGFAALQASCNTLQDAINDEEVARIAADDALQTYIDAVIATEVAARADADNALQSNLDQEISDRMADVDAEEVARVAADAALQVIIDALVANDELDYDSLADLEAAVANGFNIATTSGNVGIGTITPSEKLEVDGNIKATSYYGDGSSLTGVVITESDPVFTASAANGITLGDIINWNTAFGWGDHAFQNYLKTVAISARLSGDGIAGSPLDLAQQGASDGQVMTWDDAAGAWIPGEDDSGPWSCSYGSTVGLWHMDEGSGDMIYDETGNDNDGTIFGASWVDGKFGKALSFDGVDDYVDIPAVMPINYDIDFTISIWINVEEGSGNHWVIRMGDKGVTGAFMTGIRVLDDYVIFCCAEEMVIWEDTPGFGLNDNIWYHVVGVNQNRDMRLYVNGVFHDNAAFTRATTTSSTGHGTIGRYTPVGNSPFNGIMDEVVIFDKALSATEIEDLYNGGLYNNENIYYNIGNVGIGTANPSEKLEVDGTVKANALAGDFDHSGDSNGYVRIGDMQTVWGTFGATDHKTPCYDQYLNINAWAGFGPDVTFPISFKIGTIPVINIMPDYNYDGVFSIIAQNPSNTGFTPLAWASQSGTTGSTNRYVATGVWQ